VPDPRTPEQENYLAARTRVGVLRALQMDVGWKSPPRREAPGALRGILFAQFLGAAYSPEAGPEYLEQWAEADPRLRDAVLRNPAAPPALLVNLIRHWDPEVRRAALRHPNLPPEAREARRRRLFTEALREDPDEHLGSDVPTHLTQLVALQQAPDPVKRPRWASFARSAVWQHRLSVALAVGPRPNGQPPKPKHLALLRSLTEDGNVLGRAAARARLRGEEFAW